MATNVERDPVNTGISIYPPRPVFTEREITRLKTWLIEILPTGTGSQLPRDFDTRIHLWVNNGYRPIRQGYWAVNDYGIYMAAPAASTSNTHIALSPAGRLAILLGVAVVAGVEKDPEVEAAFHTGLGRVLRGVYCELMDLVVERNGRLERPAALAFSNEGIAARLDGKWVSPSGADMEGVEGGGWVVLEFGG
ncbi:MAG: hypothetical protein L0Y56_11665 [Nitrospira sp.]|nr:hypothetical protein [Nitrospira sp.]